MPYGNYYVPGGYGNYMSAPIPSASMQSSPIQNNSITWVQGEEAAKAYMVGAGNSAILMDSEANTFYIKSTDNSGMPMPLRVFDYTERISAPKIASTAVSQPIEEFVKREEFESLKAKLEEILSKYEQKESK